MLCFLTRETRELLGERASTERTTDPTQDYASRTNHDQMESGGPVHMEPIASEEKRAEVYFLSNGTLKSRMPGRAAFFKSPQKSSDSYPAALLPSKY